MIRPRRARQTFLLAAVLAGCAAAPSHTSGYELDVENGRVTLRLHALPLGELVKVAQEVTHERYLYDARELDAAGPFSIVGEIDCRRDEFGEFFAAMLRAHGLVAEPVDTGDGRVVRITAL